MNFTEYIPNNIRSKSIEVTDNTPLSPVRTPPVLDMPYSTRGQYPVQRHHVESVDITGQAMPENPEPGHLLYYPALAGADSFFCGAAHRRMAPFHLDERDQLTPPDNEIDVVTTQLESPFDDAPAAATEPVGGKLLRR